MVSLGVNKRDSRVRDAADTPKPWLRGCLVVTTTNRLLVNAFADDAAATRSGPLCAMLCAMHSLAGGAAAPGCCLLQLRGFIVTTQESREGTIVAMLARHDEHDTRAVRTVTRIVARCFSVAARNAGAPSVVIHDDFFLPASPTIACGVDEECSTNQRTQDTFASFHHKYLTPHVLGHPESITRRWLSEIVKCDDVCAAHCFLTLAGEERETDNDDYFVSDDDFDDNVLRSPAASLYTKSTHPLVVLTSPESKSAAWGTVAKRAGEMIENVSSSSTKTCVMETVQFQSGGGDSINATLHAFASSTCVEKGGKRDAACFVAFSVLRVDEGANVKPKHTKTKVHPALLSAFGTARAAVLADTALPSSETWAKHEPSLPYIVDEPSRPYVVDTPEYQRDDRDRSRSCSPTSPLCARTDLEFGLSGTSFGESSESNANSNDEDEKDSPSPSSPVKMKPAARPRKRTLPRFTSRARVHPVDARQVSVSTKR